MRGGYFVPRIFVWMALGVNIDESDNFGKWRVGGIVKPIGLPTYQRELECRINPHSVE